MNKEVRSLEFEIRAEETGSENRAGRLTGTPIVFSQQTDLGWIREVIEPGALDNTDLKDVRFLVGHDTTMIPLARSRNNNENSTMQLSVNERGMDIRVDLDIEGNPRAKELYSAVKRGDISGMSFMFTVNRSVWEEEESENPLRRIAHIEKVFEVSAVAFPAYDSTKLQAASDHAPEGDDDPLESALKRELQEVRERKQADRRRTAALDRLEKLQKEVRT